jgi:hypothetical protein
MELFRTQSYKAGLKRLAKLGATTADVLAMENEIARRPEAAPVIPGSGGMRKMRFAYAETGQRGGGRSIYYVLTDTETIYLLTVYPKVDKEDLTPKELKLFKALVKELNDG